MKKVKRFATKKQGGSSVRGSGSMHYVDYGPKRSNYWSPPKKAKKVTQVFKATS